MASTTAGIQQGYGSAATGGQQDSSSNSYQGTKAQSSSNTAAISSYGPNSPESNGGQMVSNASNTEKQSSYSITNSNVTGPTTVEQQSYGSAGSTGGQQAYNANQDLNTQAANSTGVPSYGSLAPSTNAAQTTAGNGYSITSDAGGSYGPNSSSVTAGGGEQNAYNSNSTTGGQNAAQPSYGSPSTDDGSATNINGSTSSANYGTNDGMNNTQSTSEQDKTSGANESKAEDSNFSTNTYGLSIPTSNHQEPSHRSSTESGGFKESDGNNLKQNKSQGAEESSTKPAETSLAEDPHPATTNSSEETGRSDTFRFDNRLAADFVEKHQSNIYISFQCLL